MERLSEESKVIPLHSKGIKGAGSENCLPSLGKRGGAVREEKKEDPCHETQHQEQSKEVQIMHERVAG